jgi:hypothetical protein
VISRIPDVVYKMALLPRVHGDVSRNVVADALIREGRISYVVSSSLSLPHDLREAVDWPVEDVRLPMMDLGQVSD